MDSKKREDNSRGCPTIDSPLRGLGTDSARAKFGVSSASEIFRSVEIARGFGIGDSRCACLEVHFGIAEVVFMALRGVRCREISIYLPSRVGDD